MASCRVTSWAANILRIFQTDPSVSDDSLLEQLLAALPDFLSLEPFLSKFDVERKSLEIGV